MNPQCRESCSSSHGQPLGHQSARKNDHEMSAAKARQTRRVSMRLQKRESESLSRPKETNANGHSSIWTKIGNNAPKYMQKLKFYLLNETRNEKTANIMVKRISMRS
jgi:hypothetical protein